MWQDEKRSPGPWPQTRWAPIVVVLALIGGALVAKIHNHVALGIFVLAIGLGAFWSAARMNQQKLHQERYMRGSGWWVGVLLAKTNVPFARGFYVLLGGAICALGVWAIVS